MEYEVPIKVDGIDRVTRITIEARRNRPLLITEPEYFLSEEQAHQVFAYHHATQLREWADFLESEQ